MDDRDLLTALENCTLPPAEFSHRNHVRAAWAYLREHPVLDALPRFVTTLKRYATSLGAAAKYHETITFAFIFLIHERMQTQQHETFDAFAAANPDLFENVLARYYPREILASPLARQTFVLPGGGMRAEG
ncbi:MAG TPA: hypothetical protein VHK90_08250 [Thermoanaerobaculia bacterium]|nr:hypothetical protein [Thermoanaerobaculia bacterium]